MLLGCYCNPSMMGTLIGCGAWYGLSAILAVRHHHHHLHLAPNIEHLASNIEYHDHRHLLRHNLEEKRSLVMALGLIKFKII